MFKNYIKIAWRNILRNKVYSSVNIVGLSVGITACILISIFILDELSYDKHWKGAERIVRVNQMFYNEGVPDPYSCTARELAAHLKNEFPEIEFIIRIDAQNHQAVSYKDKCFNEEKQYWVDPDFLEVFDFALSKGDPKNCLKEPGSVVISEAMAKKYFGHEDPMGKILKYPHRIYKVTGVLKNDSRRSHLTPGALLSMNQKMNKQKPSDWFALSVFTYIKFKNKNDINGFDQKLKGWTNKVLGPAIKENKFSFTTELLCQRLSDIYFDRYFQFNQFVQSDKKYIGIFGCIALFVLVIACFNYMNLSTARGLKRAKEVGLRKVVGADRKQLISQFLGESLVITIIALVIAFLLLIAVIPSFNSLTGKAFDLHTIIYKSAFWLTLISIIFFISLIAGSYPAFYLSYFKPADVLKGKLFGPQSSFPGGFRLRQFLVVMQFSISMVIIIVTIMVYKQLNLMMNKNLGFNKDQVLVLKFPAYMDSAKFNRIKPFKNDILRNPQIINFATTEQFVGAWRMDFYLKDNGREYTTTLNVNSGDYNYIDLLGIKIISGRNFSKEISADKFNFLINEAGLKFLNWTYPSDKEISLDGKHYGKIIGVVNDYHYKSPHAKIEPLVIAMGQAPEATGSIVLIKMGAKNISENLAFIDSKWKEYFPENPISRSFLDEKYNEQYEKDQTMLSIFTWFSCLTIIISCLGLFGLASFSTEQRVKEIGIRKVLGAKTSQITLMISKDFMILILVAIVVALPIAYYFINRWLQDFAYRSYISAWVFIISGTLMILISFISISFQTLKAALSNPVKSLKTE